MVTKVIDAMDCLGFRVRGNASTAEANVRSAIPLPEAANNDSRTYMGLANSAERAPPGMLFYDAGECVTVAGATYTAYCVIVDSGGKAVPIAGPGAIDWHTMPDWSGTGMVCTP